MGLVVPTDQARSALMKRVRRERTAPEDDVAVLLRAAGIRTHRNVKSLPGSPDFANKRRRIAVFVNGCFWHGHKGCVRSRTPRTNTEFWSSKIAANKLRDARKASLLRSAGFTVVVIWECELKSRAAELKVRRLKRQVECCSMDRR